jgi:alkylation response protein AidB-like acyl-CoA dehydrogenase
VSSGAQEGDPLTGDQILANARALAGRIRERDLAAVYDELRQLPSEVVDELRESGVMRMNMPRSWGGPEMTSMQQVEVIEELSKADASVGWCSFIWCDSGIYSGYLDDAVAREMYPRLDMATSGWVYPVVPAKRVDEGYMITGQWMFGSGSNHCDLLVAGCIVDDVDSEDPIDLWRIMIARRGAKVRCGLVRTPLCARCPASRWVSPPMHCGWPEKRWRPRPTGCLVFRTGRCHASSRRS